MSISTNFSTNIFAKQFVQTLKTLAHAKPGTSFFARESGPLEIATLPIKVREGMRPLVGLSDRTNSDWVEYRFISYVQEYIRQYPLSASQLKQVCQIAKHLGYIQGNTRSEFAHVELADLIRSLLGPQDSLPAKMHADYAQKFYQRHAAILASQRGCCWATSSIQSISTPSISNGTVENSPKNILAEESSLNPAAMPAFNAPETDIAPSLAISREETSNTTDNTDTTDSSGTAENSPKNIPAGENSLNLAAMPVSSAPETNVAAPLAISGEETSNTTDNTKGLAAVNDVAQPVIEGKENRIEQTKAKGISKRQFIKGLSCALFALTIAIVASKTLSRASIDNSRKSVSPSPFEPPMKLDPLPISEGVPTSDTLSTPNASPTVNTVPAQGISNSPPNNYTWDGAGLAEQLIPKRVPWTKKAIQQCLPEELPLFSRLWPDLLFSSILATGIMAIYRQFQRGKERIENAEGSIVLLAERATPETLANGNEPIGESSDSESESTGEAIFAGDAALASPWQADEESYRGDQTQLEDYIIKKMREAKQIIQELHRESQALATRVNKREKALKELIPEFMGSESGESANGLPSDQFTGDSVVEEDPSGGKPAASAGAFQPPVVGQFLE